MERCNDCGRDISWRLKGRCIACRYKEIMSKYIPKEDKTYTTCKKKFYPKTRSQIYCCPECRTSEKKKEQEERACAICGNVFRLESGQGKAHKKYCSPACVREAAARNRASQRNREAAAAIKRKHEYNFRLPKGEIIKSRVNGEVIIRSPEELEEKKKPAPRARLKIRPEHLLIPGRTETGFEQK